ncbi:helix-turn-helix domain-containing protein [Thermophilibacter provencensis]|uniref:helix-turn-helix domain-containing protein n=1 Tax=Thermophilibacter provencensis TaxID=1852386 RepID=UPI002357539F|nr:helix-turn-helix transcriptional regulator [Thermophilibacter provencensis]
MDEKNEALGRRIARLRLEHGMTQERLASELGVTAQAVSKWENDLSAPDISLLPALAKTFGVSVDQLLGVVPIVRAVVPVQAAAPAEPGAAFEPEPEAAPRPDRGGRPHTLHIQLHDGDDGNDVNINVPLGLADMVLGASRKAPGAINLNLNDAGVDLDLVSEAIKRGEKGTLLDIDDGDGDHVTITLE